MSIFDNVVVGRVMMEVVVFMFGVIIVWFEWFLVNLM